ncbi:MAG: bifunctional phosphoribosylaminoimidazolecarboxamide formyltransferase/IMP cyclohydrolase [Negativicutes bacterium]
MKVKRALISVSDKTGVVDFAKALSAMGIEIVSTGGTMKTLQEAGIPVIYISDVTGFPEMMDGRVKTLNPYIHGGILAVRDNPEHVSAMTEHGIRPIDLVVVNLYPFRQTVAKPGVTQEEAVENIDIGGPAMVRSAAKNFRYVTVIVNPDRYDDVIHELAEFGEVTADTRLALVRDAFTHTAEYDAAISRYFSAQTGEGEYPSTLILPWEKLQDLRYGENPHQTAAFYRDNAAVGGVAHAKQLAGKELSFNNIVDLESAYAIVADFSGPAAAIIKHTNPCGAATADDIAAAYKLAYEADPVSAFGGIVGLNRPVDAATAEQLKTIFLEAVIAPGFAAEALEILGAKKNVRLIEAVLPDADTKQRYDIKTVSGGMVIQSADTQDALPSEWKTVTKRAPTIEELHELELAWKVVKHVKSNAIIVARDGRTVGVGAGQMNRVGSAEIALKQAGDAAKGAVLSSDAFFPFRDTVDAAAKAGITAIIQPGGSVRDEESIAAADEHGIAMIFTGMRHFKH